MSVRPEFAVCLLLLATTGTIFWKVIGYEFIVYDTHGYILGNSMVRQGLTWNGVAWAFSTFYMSNWHPVTWISHMFDVQLFGLNAGGHHLVNLILHGANTLLLFTTLRMMTRALWASALVAVLFAVHPLHVESVAWIAERKDCLSAFFFFSAIRFYAAYVRHLSFSSYLLALIFFGFGLMAKPMVVTFPFVLLLLDYWPMNRYVKFPLIANAPATLQLCSTRSLIMEKVPFFILMLVSCFITFLAQQKGGSVGGFEQFPFWMRLVNALTAYGGYCLKLFLPMNLSVFYPYPEHVSIFKIVAAGLLLGILTVLSVYSCRRRPWFIVGWFWFLGTLVPVIGIVQVGSQAMADRYTYLPAIGIFIVISWFACEMAEKSCRHKQIVQLVVLGAMVVLAVITSYQLNVWRSSVTLFSHTLKITGTHPLVNYYLGTALAEQGEYDLALHHYRQSLKVDSGNELAHLNIGIVYQQRGQLDKAKEHYLRALDANPLSWKAHHNLGLNLVAAGDVTAAIEQYLIALKLVPESAKVHNSLAVALISVGDIQGAVDHLEQALRLNPGYKSAQRNLKKLKGNYVSK